MKTIIKTTALMVVFFLGQNVFAQPSDSDVKSRALRDGATKVEFYGTGNVHTTPSETYYIRSFTATYPTDYSGVTQLVSMEYKYIKSGGSWNFSREFIVEVLYDGIPNPTEDEIMTMINADMKEFLGGSYTDVVGDIESIKMADDPHWMWHSVTSVSVNMEAIYSKKMSSTKVSRVKQIHTVRLYAEEFKGPWTSMNCSKDGYPEILSTEVYTSEEVNNMKTMYDIDLDKEAEALMAGLPEVTIPAFTNEKEAIVYTYKLLREATYDEFKAYMYQMLSDNFFHDNSKVLNQSGERMFEDMENVFNSRTAFKDQYCEHPKVKYDTDTQMEFWNRAEDRHTRIAIHKKGDAYEITALSAYVFVKDEDINRVKGMGDANCGEPINTVPYVAETFEIGDNVEVQVGGKWYSGKIEKRDTYNDERYFVRCTTINSLWAQADNIRQSTGTSTETNDSNNPGTTDTNGGNTEGTNSGTNETENGNKDAEGENSEEKKDKKKIKVNPNKAKNLKGKVKIGG